MGGAQMAVADDGMLLSDMHFHMFFPGTLPGRYLQLRPLAESMAEGRVTLLSWSLVGDLPWITATPRGLRQKGDPNPGAAKAWFERDLERIKRHVAEQGLKLALTPADVAKAEGGEPHVVLSVEGATFLDESPENLQIAYDQGIRHLQLVHYIRNVLGDFQTEEPRHGGLSERGRATVRECNRLGILIDLAHATGPMVEQVLEISTAPVIWSHSMVSRDRVPAWTMGMPFARHLALKHAKAIAQKGGVVGLWALRSDTGGTPLGYARKLAEMVEMLGDDHVGVGTDYPALARPSITSYRDLKLAFEALAHLGMAPASVRKVAIGNYARVLKAALQPAA